MVSSSRVSRSNSAGLSAGLSEEGEGEDNGEDDESVQFLYVGNLLGFVSSKWIFASFGKFGKVVDIYRPQSRKCWYVFVRLLGLNSAKAAIKAMDGLRVGGRFLAVRWAFRRKMGVLNKGAVVVRQRTIESIGGLISRGKIMRGNSESFRGVPASKPGCSPKALKWVSNRKSDLLLDHCAVNHGVSAVVVNGLAQSASNASPASDEASGKSEVTQTTVCDVSRIPAGGEVSLEVGAGVLCNGTGCKRLDGLCSCISGKMSNSPNCFNPVSWDNGSRRVVLGCGGNGWLSKSIVAMLRDDVFFEEVSAEIGVCCKEVYRVSRLSVDSVLMSFHSSELCKNALKDYMASLNHVVCDESPRSAKWFVSMNMWSPSTVGASLFRLWVSVSGIPPNAWNHSTFQAIATVWGSLIDVEDGTYSLNQFYVARLCIATRVPVIFADIDLVVDNLSYVVHVTSDSAFTIKVGVVGVHNSKINHQVFESAVIPSLCDHASSKAKSANNSDVLSPSSPKMVLSENSVMAKPDADVVLCNEISCLNQVGSPLGHAVVVNGEVFLLSKVQSEVSAGSSSTQTNSDADVICSKVKGQSCSHIGKFADSDLGPVTDLCGASKVSGVSQKDVSVVDIDEVNHSVQSVKSWIGDVRVIVGLGASLLDIAKDGKCGDSFEWELIPLDDASDVLCSGLTKLNRTSVLKVLSIVNISLQVAKASGVSFTQQDERLIRCFTIARLLNLEKGRIKQHDLDT